MKKKERLDVLLVEQQFFPTREKARRFIMTGNVLVDNVPVDKPGTKVACDAALRLRGEPLPYVGRGGLKLAKALATFPLTLSGRTMMDIGASTGGFTDCALQHGVRKVYAVDVGYGQLDWILRNSPQVVNWERTNIKDITPTMLPERIDFITIDVSFISLLKVLPTAVNLLAERGDIVALIKPQFEAGRQDIGKGGIVRDPKIHRRVLETTLTTIEEYDLEIGGLTRSPITGADGNVEFLVWVYRPRISQAVYHWQSAIDQVLNAGKE